MTGVRWLRNRPLGVSLWVPLASLAVVCLIAALLGPLRGVQAQGLLPVALRDVETGHMVLLVLDAQTLFELNPGTIIEVPRRGTTTRAFRRARLLRYVVSVRKRGPCLLGPGVRARICGDQIAFAWWEVERVE